MFHGAPSEYLWEDSCGTVHRIPQGEGGELGDALMPLLFAVGQHSALEEASAQLLPGEHLFAFHDDIYMVTMPERVGAVYAIVEEQLRTRARIRIHGGKTKVWNRGGERLAICDVLERIARVQNPQTVVWRGSDIPSHQQGITVLGTPLGHVDFIGCCSSSVLLHAPITSSVPCTLALWSGMLDLTMRTFGNALGASFKLTLACAVTRSGRPPHCPSFLEGLASEALTV